MLRLRPCLVGRRSFLALPSPRKDVAGAGEYFWKVKLASDTASFPRTNQVLMAASYHISLLVQQLLDCIPDAKARTNV